ncbi:MAG: 4Fe-4S ferredoxin [Burkholderiales bacterium PBB6]|nr:MAG: 4Fe-4S ferredoxin [Burkholderiales bacterium PBB6]
MPLNAPALSQALAKTPGADTDGLETVHSLLCRREAGSFQRAAKSGDDVLVACTQESRLFLDLNTATEGTQPVTERPIRFVNLRETGGWSKDGAQATPKLAALIAAAQLPDPTPVATVPYRSSGRTLVIGSADDAVRMATLLADKLYVTLLLDGPGGALPQRRDWPVHTGQLTRLTGWLGQFEAQWSAGNPIDAELCTRCNACIDVCPEGAIDFSYQVDLARCNSHRACVQVCEVAGAIDFNRSATTITEAFDLVLDLREAPAFSQHQPPQGYFHPGRDERRRMDAVLQLREMVGEFDKPKFFHYTHKLCAHSRNEQIGCSACIDVCSTSAIRSNASLKGVSKQVIAQGGGGGIIVEPHLCVGCGACTTVCPSGALAYATPDTVDMGKRLRTLVGTYQRAGGKHAALLVHSQGAGTQLIDELGRAARTQADVHGVPARVLPMAVWHTASMGLDLWLSAIAMGASQIMVLLTDEEAPEYRQALTEQMAVAQAILHALGFDGQHLHLLEARDARDLASLDTALRCAPAATVAQPLAMATQANKRATLDMALDHLLSQAPTKPEAIALPKAGSPFGSLQVNTDRCTLCLACVGACPEGALADNTEKPQLRFIEKNCVQCGLCVSTCPETAITLEPRLWLADEGKARKSARVLHEAAPFACIRCAKPFGTLKAIENMLGKLAGHPAFQGAAADRLKMCNDCRVVDMFSDQQQTHITKL